MKKHPIQVTLLLCLFGFGATLAAADEQGNPLADLLGKELDQVRHRFLFVVDDNDRKDPHCDIHHCPDFNLWFVLDKKTEFSFIDRDIEMNTETFSVIKQQIQFVLAMRITMKLGDTVK